jgi:hypothetical protein
MEEPLIKEVFIEFKDVFAEFKNKLEKLIEIHDTQIEKQSDRITILENRTQKAEIAQINANWKALLYSALGGASGVKGIEKLLEILHK